jgi:hypothetical protein
MNKIVFNYWIISQACKNFVFWQYIWHKQTLDVQCSTGSDEKCCWLCNINIDNFSKTDLLLRQNEIAFKLLSLYNKRENNYGRSQSFQVHGYNSMLYAKISVLLMSYKYL